MNEKRAKARSNSKTNLNERVFTNHPQIERKQKSGDPNRSRTCDLSLRRRPLYPSELWDRLWQIQQRINRFRLQSYLEMKMRTGRIAGVSDFGNLLALLHLCVFFCYVFRIMSINRKTFIRMLDYYQQTVTALFTYENDRSCRRCVNRCSDRASYVDPAVVLSPARTEF